MGSKVPVGLPTSRYHLLWRSGAQAAWICHCSSPFFALFALTVPAIPSASDKFVIRNLALHPYGVRPSPNNRQIDNLSVFLGCSRSVIFSYKRPLCLFANEPKLIHLAHLAGPRTEALTTDLSLPQHPISFFLLSGRSSETRGKCPALLLPCVHWLITVLLFFPRFFKCLHSRIGVFERIEWQEWAGIHLEYVLGFEYG